MRHRLAGRHLNRNHSHRVALFRNLARALFTHEQIKTTVAKAKSLRPFAEKLITLAKKAAIANDGSPEGKIKALHYRRLAISELGPMHGTGVWDKKNDLDPVFDTVLKKLFDEIGPRYKDRPGGYTRVLKLHTRRLGDAGEQAIISLLKAGETKEKKARTPAPAPMPTPVETESAPST
jgi:large subunit ribosomal protein L17